jgi:hypothetical protein
VSDDDATDGGRVRCSWKDSSSRREMTRVTIRSGGETRREREREKPTNYLSNSMSPPLTCTTRASITCPSRPRTRSFARRGEGRPRGHDASASRRARLERYRSSRTRPLPFRRPRRVDSPRFARDAPNASEASSARCPLSRGSRCSRRPCTWRASPPLDAPRPLTPRRSRAPTRRRRGTRRRRPRARETALLRWKMNRRGRRRRGNARAVQRAPGRASRTRTRRRMMTAARRLRGRRSPRTSSPPPPPRGVERRQLKLKGVDGGD